MVFGGGPFGTGPYSGSPLHAVASSVDEQELQRVREQIDSFDWTGLHKPASEEQMAEIKARVRALHAAIIQSDLDQRLKSNAEHRLRALECMLEAPDVPWKQVVELLNSPAFTAFMTALNLIQFILGSVS